MPELKDACRYIRSKVAGPFWITYDLFFKDRDNFQLYADSPALQVGALADLFGVEAASIKRFVIPDLMVIKFSYPRTSPQGGMIERDLHSGQQYVRALSIEL